MKKETVEIVTEYFNEFGDNDFTSLVYIIWLEQKLISSREQSEAKDKEIQHLKEQLKAKEEENKSLKQMIQGVIDRSNNNTSFEDLP